MSDPRIVAAIDQAAAAWSAPEVMEAANAAIDAAQLAVQELTERGIGPIEACAGVLANITSSMLMGAFELGRQERTP